MKAHCLKALYPESAQEEFGKIRKIARRESMIKYNFNKITDIQYTFAKIRLYRV